ncbi:MAG: ABC transporter permease [Tahibacter sp.]
MFSTLFDPLSLRSLAIEARCEFLRLLRAPGFSVPTLLFPLLSYLLFGIALGGGSRAGYHASHYLLASYSVFGVISPALFGFGVSVALERERGLLRLKRALPMPPANYLLAKLFMAMLFAVLIFFAMSLLAVLTAGVRLEVSQWIGLASVAILGVIPFCALGLFIGSWVNGQAAAAVVNMIYLPMAFMAGLAIPLFLLPQVLQSIAPIWPAYHLAQLAQAAIGQPSLGSVSNHILVLGGFAIVAFVAARRRMSRVDAVSA